MIMDISKKYGRYFQYAHKRFQARQKNFEKCYQLRHASVSNHLPTWRNSAPTERIFTKIIISEFLENIFTNFNFFQHLTQITGNLCEDVCTFMVSCLILFLISHSNEKCLRENLQGASKHTLHEIHFFITIFFLLRQSENAVGRRLE